MAATRVKKTSKSKALHSKAKKKAKPTKKRSTKAKARPTRSKSKLASLLKTVKNAVKFSHHQTRTTPLEKVDNAFNKSQLLSTLAERSALTKKQAAVMMDEFCQIMGVHLKKGGPEKFILPGAFKIVIKNMPARKARSGVNPFTGEPTVFKAKPAFRRVRIIPLKGLKEMAHK